ncbi:ATP12 family chaperone protein [Pseudooceanicola aestuarii]|uniref:ATP12 family chaperone protein n=1 Tax=Pseudooceanicola aestuarii TaxID=2697319 RepID=UPI0013D46872|nr:ATP12 family protein [Pseudooceanicola aestuarii]
MSEWAPRRFWKQAVATPQDGGFAIHLDNRPVRTPAKAPLIVPSAALAHAIAAEWDAQVETVNPASMPVTRAANAAIDKVTPQREEVVAMLADYGDSDLLCYRATSPEALMLRQAAAWDPLLDWAGATLGARLQPRPGVMHAPQDPRDLARLKTQVSEMSAFELTAFHDLVSLSGSLILGFAAFHGARPIGEIWTLSRIDEDWQQEQWGADEEATAQAAHKEEAFLNARRFLDFLHAA